MSGWTSRAAALAREGHVGALVTVTATRGSTPREAGAWMLVHAGGQWGTVGGGRLEHEASRDARRLCTEGGADRGFTREVRLGPGLGQCCGGEVSLFVQRVGAANLPQLLRMEALDGEGMPYVWMCALGPGGTLQRALLERGSGDAADRETAALRHARALLEQARPRPRVLVGDAGPVLLLPHDPRGPDVVLFGAGHVGRALVQVLAPLGWPLRWVETRDDAFPSHIPVGTEIFTTDAPEACVDEAKPGSVFLIMSHDHALDYRLCARVLGRGDAAYCGVIGSRTKRAKFVARLSDRGFAQDAIASLICPIGLPEVQGKAPGAIAVSVAAQLVGVAQAAGYGR